MVPPACLIQIGPCVLIPPLYPTKRLVFLETLEDASLVCPTYIQSVKRRTSKDRRDLTLYIVGFVLWWTGVTLEIVGWDGPAGDWVGHLGLVLSLTVLFGGGLIYTLFIDTDR